MNSFQVLSRVYRLGRKMHPDISPGSVKHQVLMLGAAASNLSLLSEWYETKDNPLRGRAVQKYPLIEGAMYWPYINHKWSMEKKLKVIDAHYRILNHLPLMLKDATFADKLLVSCEDEYPTLRLVLEKAPWFMREGELVLSIFVGIDRVYSVAFSLGEESGQKIIYVGALQGRSLENAMEIYRNLTHALHGMRPRDFLMSALKMLCSHIGVKKIWGISSSCRQHHGKYFSGSHKEKLLADYDEVWQEHDGVDMKNCFYSIPPVVAYREASEIPARKRASYKRRYAMLDKLAININNALKAT